MTKQIVKSLLFTVVAAALVTLPVASRAQSTTNMPATKAASLPFHGKAATVDSAAMSLTVGTMTFEVTSTTKIVKNNKPATLEDIKVGDMLGGAYVKTEDGKLKAITIHDGLKAKKKKTATTGSTGTNAPAGN